MMTSLMDRLLRKKPSDEGSGKDVDPHEEDGQITVVETPKTRQIPRGMLWTLLIGGMVMMTVVIYIKGMNYEQQKVQEAKEDEDSKYAPEQLKKRSIKNSTETAMAIDDEIATAEAAKPKPKVEKTDFSAAGAQSTTPNSRPPQYVAPSVEGGEISMSAAAANGEKANPAESEDVDAQGRKLPPPPPLAGTPFNPKQITSTRALVGNESPAVKSTSLIVLEDSSQIAFAEQNKGGGGSASPLMRNVLTGD